MPTTSFVRLEVAKSQLILHASDLMIDNAAEHLQHLKNYHAATQNFLQCGESKRRAAKEKCEARYTDAVKSRIAVIETARHEMIEAKERLDGNATVLEKFYRLPSEEETK